MGILNREEFFAKLESRLSNDTSDEGIAFLEDMTDTYNDLERKANGDGVDWEARCREIDESWKKRYRHRFFSGGCEIMGAVGNEPNVIDEYSPEEINFDSLFTKKEDK